MKPKIAICAKPQLPLGDTCKIARNNGYIAVDWTVELDRLSFFKSDRTSFDQLLNGQDHKEVRYHCPLAQFEIAHINPYISRNSVKLIKKCIDVIPDFGGRFLTLHLGGAGTIEQLSWDNAARNLSELVGYGNKRGVIVCVENLKSGWTCDPALVSKLVDLSGAKVTFDVGHANSSVYARSGEASSLDFLAAISDSIVNAHVYEAEDPYHIAPENLDVIGPVLEALIKTSCDWWVVELDDHESIEMTRSLLYDFLDEN